MKGFNFKEHIIKDLNKDYIMKTLTIDYSTKYLEQDLESGSKYILGVFEDLVSSFIPNHDYYIQIGIDEFLDNSDQFLLFSAFSGSFKGKPNKKGYLKAPDRVANFMSGSEYNKTLLMNQDFEYGTIQLEIATKDEVYTWIL